MKNITSATEKRIETMIKNDTRYSKLMLEVLDGLKSKNGLYGATIKQMKEWNITLPTSFQLNFSEDYDLNGLAYNYPNLLNTVYCLDLAYINMKDFNELVKVIYNSQFSQIA